MVWILTGLSGLVLTLGSDWMGASRLCTGMVWSELVLVFKQTVWSGLVWLGMVRSLLRLPVTRDRIPFSLALCRLPVEANPVMCSAA